MTEESFGVIPLQKQNGLWHCLLVQLYSGDHWGFPKGHALPHEHPMQAAVRELQEETGLFVTSFLSQQSWSEQYTVNREHGPVTKNVHYFVAEVQGDVQAQPYEVKDIVWLPLESVENKVTYPQLRDMWRDILSSLNEILVE